VWHRRSPTTAALDSAYLIALPPLALALAFAVHGCQATIGPLLPGCEDQSAIVCDGEHVCAEHVCEGLVWICGSDSGGFFSWSRSAAPCSDNDACTMNDVCVSGVCVGTPVDCSVPPSPTCKDPSTLQTWSAGTCAAGACTYPVKELSCVMNDCQNGQCQSDPCYGKTCDVPPNGSPCYTTPGTCVGGNCVYAAKASGEPCTLADKCIKDTACDGQGACTGTTIDCKDSAHHVQGGTCVGGVCQNLVCVDPWKDCDGDTSNGCEIPASVADRCNSTGIPTSGTPCGTAHCGDSGGTYNFPSKHFHCHICSHAHKFTSTTCSWCLGPSSGGTGNYSSAKCPISGTGACCNSGTAYDKVCN
jgi:hypothetical protein